MLTTNKNDVSMQKRLSILGGGPGGLATGYYARKRNIPFTIYEQQDHVGGNCITLRHNDFYFDSGAHRFHDKFPEITIDMKELMGDELVRIDVPSEIFYKHKLIDFPLSPLNLIKNLGIPTFLKAGFEVVRARLNGANAYENFENFALYRYGKTIADLFLLNYTEKLWGAPCSRLSWNISGNRMKGLNLRTFIKEALLGNKAKTEHLDGSFYYPTKKGIGLIMDKLEGFCGYENIRTNAKVSTIFHSPHHIDAIQVNGQETVETDDVVSTLPVNRLLASMDPKPPQEILDLAAGLQFRNMVLVALFLDMESVTKAASVYFPGRSFLFTRFYEARNRNVTMSPPGKTSVVTEIPCQKGDDTWNMDDKQLVQIISKQLVETGLIREDKILDSQVVRMHDAYPKLELGSEEKIRAIFSYLNTFDNLRVSGRNGKFLYTHIHDMMKFGKDIIAEYPFGSMDTKQPPMVGFTPPGKECAA